MRAPRRIVSDLYLPDPLLWTRRSPRRRRRSRPNLAGQIEQDNEERLLAEYAAYETTGIWTETVEDTDDNGSLNDIIKVTPELAEESDEETDVDTQRLFANGSGRLVYKTNRYAYRRRPRQS